MPRDVRCTVDTCHYWSNNNECHASQIVVTNDKFGAVEDDSVDATNISNSVRTPADTCMETNCKTFVNKNDSASRRRADNIY
jgi:hypothetical protein